MDNEKIALEFEFLRDNLKQIARLLIENHTIEAVFMIGCLHSICHQHALIITKKNRESNVDS
jgi:hypothetical protein